MMPRVILLALLPLAALADPWPSWLSPNVGSYDRGNQALSGAVERLTVAVGPEAWTNYMTTNLWASWFSQGTKCRVSKTMLAAAVDAGGWVQRNDSWTPDNSVALTKANLAALVGAPATVWTNHAYVNLAAHSNGWRFVPALMSNTVWRKDSKNVSYFSTSCVWWGSGYATSTVEAKANAEASWAIYDNSYGLDGVAYSFISPGEGVGVAAELFVSGIGYTFNFPTNFARDSYAWGYGLLPEPGGGYVNIFTNHGTSLIETNYAVFASQLAGMDSTWTAYLGTWGGSTNDPGKPAWYTGEITDYTYFGYDIDPAGYGRQIHALTKWNTATNGFRWFR